MPVLLINTGGTMSMLDSQEGFKPKNDLVEEAVKLAGINAELVDTVEVRNLSPLVDSANLKPSDWNRIVKLISDSYDYFDAFVVVHGTDTLAFTAAALCFALEGLAKPVILTGAMLPLSFEESDGRKNMVDSFGTAKNINPGVWVQFAGRLLHGACVQKVHSRDFESFSARENSSAPCQAGMRLRCHKFGRPNVPILTIAPGSSTDLIKYALSNCDGAVLRCYGSGTISDELELGKALKIASMREIPVLAVSQCFGGGLDFEKYAAGAILRDSGVIDGRDITVEAAYVKLVHVLEYSNAPATQFERLAVPLCGEFTA